MQGTGMSLTLCQVVYVVKFPQVSSRDSREGRTLSRLSNLHQTRDLETKSRSIWRGC